MSILFDHMIVPATNRVAAARQRAGLPGVPWAEQAAIGPFSAVCVSPSRRWTSTNGPRPSFGGRLVHWREPDGHAWEMLTMSDA